MVTQYQPRVAITPPYLQPLDTPNERLYPSMQCQPIFLPLVVLINAQQVINTSCPEPLPLQATMLSLSDEVNLIGEEIFLYNRSIESKFLMNTKDSLGARIISTNLVTETPSSWKSRLIMSLIPTFGHLLRTR